MNVRTALKIMLLLITAVTIFHFSILLKIVPYDITWGGRLKNDTEMYTFESLSIVINVLLFIMLLIKGSYIKPVFPLRVVNMILWGFFMLFGLNTIGNLLASTVFEKSFAAITLAFSILLWIILRAKNNERTSLYNRQ